MANVEDVPEKKGVKGKLMIVALLLGGGAGGFAAVSSGVFTQPASSKPHAAEVALPDISYVPIPLLIASLPGNRHLRFGAQIEVAPHSVESVTYLMPRILDTMNEYLRTVKVGDVEGPQSLMIIRAHLLRRLQVVIGFEEMHDLLITEFVVD